jgi:prepilin-type N-terminal cleavage/methylation domain-containing protein
MSQRIGEQDMHVRREEQPKLGSVRITCGAGGFTLIEMMIAVAVLAVGMLGAMSMMLMGMQTNTASKTDTTATVLDQEVIELYSSLKVYPPPAAISITDCALAASNTHLADFTPLGVGTSSGATLYTAATAPTPSQVGDIDWTAPVTTLATGATQGFAMDYQTCSGDVYEVRWNMTDFSPAGSVDTQLLLLTVSARQRSAVVANTAGAQNRAVLYAVPTTLRTLIER